jgi:8-oxo-dGTP pyrophosphatase MutT (NUDIX family)
MKKSCGIIVLYNDKILLCHPTKSKWTGTYGVPKGRIEIGEEIIDCAVREFFEETGIKINKSVLNSSTIIQYRNYQTQEIYKELHLYIHRINHLSEIGLELEIIPQIQLQQSEIDWCGFLTKEEASIKIFPKQISILNFL